MRLSIILPLFSITSFCSAQLKPCYSGGTLTDQIPCDPSANVSACCAPGGACVTNLYCHGKAVGDQFERVGGCTDRTGNDPACPLPFLQDPDAWNWFTYAGNTTNCGDGTFCMDPGNETCCFNGEGVKEITYHNTATIPTVAEEWTTYYEDAGYSVPTTTSTASASTFPTSKGTTSTSISSTSISSTSISSTSISSTSISSTSISSTSISSTSISSTSTTMPAQSHSLNLPQAVSRLSAPTAIPEPAPASTTRTAVGPREKVVIGTASALGVLGALVLVGLLYQIRRSRAKRLEKTRSELAPEVVNFEELESTGHSTPTQTDATWDWSSKGARPGAPMEMIGQEEVGEIAEMSG